MRPPNYQEGKCSDGIHHLYTRGAEHLSPRSTINVVVTPSHWITSINVRVAVATREEPRADLTWMLRHPYAYLPPVQYRDHRQVAPTGLQERLQEQAGVPARVHYEHRWGPNYEPGLGLPLDWFTGDQQRPIVAHRMRNLPAMTVLVAHTQHRNVQLHEQCPLCGSGPETVQHVRACPVQTHEWHPARQRVPAWLTTCVGPRASQVQSQLWDPAVLEQWAAAIATPALRMAHMGLTGPHDIGMEFLRQVVEESQRVWLHATPHKRRYSTTLHDATQHDTTAATRFRGGFEGKEVERHRAPTSSSALSSSIAFMRVFICAICSSNICDPDCFSSWKEWRRQTVRTIPLCPTAMPSPRPLRPKSAGARAVAFSFERDLQRGGGGGEALGPKQHRLPRQ